METLSSDKETKQTINNIDHKLEIVKDNKQRNLPVSKKKNRLIINTYKDLDSNHYVIKYTKPIVLDEHNLDINQFHALAFLSKIGIFKATSKNLKVYFSLTKLGKYYSKKLKFKNKRKNVSEIFSFLKSLALALLISCVICSFIIGPLISILVCLIAFLIFILCITISWFSTIVESVNEASWLPILKDHVSKHKYQAIKELIRSHDTETISNQEYHDLLDL